MDVLLDRIEPGKGEFGSVRDSKLSSHAKEDHGACYKPIK
jgi:hypothetical protein